MLALEWLAYRNLVRQLPTDLYVGIVAILFVGIGLGVGYLLTQKRTAAFAPNRKAAMQLGLTPRELEILELLADGQANKEIARVLGISPNTVKTHIANLAMKLEVSGRGRLVSEARSLALIP